MQRSSEYSARINAVKAYMKELKAVDRNHSGLPACQQRLEALERLRNKALEKERL